MTLETRYGLVEYRWCDMVADYRSAAKNIYRVAQKTGPAYFIANILKTS